MISSHSRTISNSKGRTELSETELRETTGSIDELSLRKSGTVGEAGWEVFSRRAAWEMELTIAGGWDWCNAGELVRVGEAGVVLGVAVGGGVGVISFISSTRCPASVLSLFEEEEPPKLD